MKHLARRRIASTITIVLAIIAIALAGLIYWNFRAGRTGELPPSPLPPTQPGRNVLPVAVIARNLEIPWALDFLPDGSIILTERQGRIRIVDATRGLITEPLLTINEVAHRGEGGLLGIAAHPDFAENHFIYVYYTYQEGNALGNKVMRFRKEGDRFSEPTVIIEGIPGATIHNGGRLKFGPDGYLYITTGDAATAESAQDRTSLSGKILRLEDDGAIPSDNPFPNSPVYSYGHRNPQGLAWDSQGRLWATEHGSNATDELNRIEPGKNYGWPLIRGNEGASGMESPVLQSGQETWAPSGLAFLNGSLYYAGLRGQTLFEVPINEELPVLNRHFVRNFGRLRDVVVGPDGFLYVLTGNRDGRGLPTADDDHLIKVESSFLAQRD